jgi:hypothetical protein
MNWGWYVSPDFLEALYAFARGLPRLLASNMASAATRGEADSVVQRWQYLAREKKRMIAAVQTAHISG